MKEGRGGVHLIASVKLFQTNMRNDVSLADRVIQVIKNHL